jgi:hypothetical protein
MPEKFIGKLEWITMGGRLDVRHPDGRLIRTGPVNGDDYAKASALRKMAVVEVEIPDDIPGRGAFSPWVLSIDERASQPATDEGE